MTVYVLAMLKFTDRAAYDRYQARFFSVFKKFNGRVLAADEKPKLLEGSWDREKVVILSFPDEAEAMRFMNDSEYNEFSKHRHAGAQTVSVLLKGLPGS